MSPDEMTKCFSRFLSTYTGIFPPDIPIEKRDAIIKDLESVYKEHMIKYYANLTDIIKDRVKSD
jgi:hypothetical protein